MRKRQQQLTEESTANDSTQCNGDTSQSKRLDVPGSTELPTHDQDQGRGTKENHAEKRSSLDTSENQTEPLPQPSPIPTKPDKCQNKTSLRPPPDQQRKDVIRLLSQSSPNGRVGEAFLLIHYEWWRIWCRHVNFFMRSAH